MNDVLQLLRDHKAELFRKYHLKSMALFGSYSRGEETKDSDVDVVVELSAPVALGFIELGWELESILRKKVDLVSLRGIKPRYLAAIESDFIYV